MPVKKIQILETARKTAKTINDLPKNKTTAEKNILERIPDTDIMELTMDVFKLGVEQQKKNDFEKTIKSFMNK